VGAEDGVVVVGGDADGAGGLPGEGDAEDGLLAGVGEGLVLGAEGVFFQEIANARRGIEIFVSEICKYTHDK
jgi:hypothetical protein